MTARALVTGAAGFVASHLAGAWSAATGAAAVGLDVRAPAARPGFDAVHVVALEDGVGLAEVVRSVNPTHVFHLAGRTAGAWDEVYAGAVTGVGNLLAAVARWTPSARVLVAGSAAEYGRSAADYDRLPEDARCEPVGAYGAAKRAATQVALDAARYAGVDVRVVRPFNILGRGMPATLFLGALAGRVAAAKRSGADAVPIGNLDSVRDFIGVGDAVRGMVRLLESDEARGSVVNLCSGVGTRVGDLADLLARRAGYGGRLTVDPALYRPDDLPRVVGDPTRAAALGVCATESLDAAVADVWAGVAG